MSTIHQCQVTDIAKRPASREDAHLSDVSASSPVCAIFEIDKCVEEPAVAEFNEDGTRKRKKKNRWGDATDNKAAGLMGLPTKIEAAMTSEQLEAYTLHLRIEEISQKLRINDVVPADGDRYVRNLLNVLPCCPQLIIPSLRSPSPPPQYDNMGRRINTREFRYRKRLEDERHKLIEKAMKAIPNYHPPSDYRRPTKTQEKIYVPVNDYPEINFSTNLLSLLFLTHISFSHKEALFSFMILT